MITSDLLTILSGKLFRVNAIDSPLRRKLNAVDDNVYISVSYAPEWTETAKDDYVALILFQDPTGPRYGYTRMLTPGWHFRVPHPPESCAIAFYASADDYGLLMQALKECNIQVVYARGENFQTGNKTA